MRTAISTGLALLVAGAVVLILKRRQVSLACSPDWDEPEDGIALDPYLTDALERSFAEKAARR